MIYTLYSFKGGVGRSMALANLAAYFCKKGLRVVMIDWDLEAPGLESYFYSAEAGKSAELARSIASPGLIDLFADYKKKFPGLRLDLRLAQRPTLPDAGDLLVPAGIELESSVASEDAFREAAEVARITREHRQRLQASEQQQANSSAASEASPEPPSFDQLLDRTFPSIEQYLQPIETPTPGGLWLFPAGARGPDKFGDYADAVQDFDWLEFIADFDGKGFLEWLRDKLSAFADVVLIDSRTGVTEMSGICTRQMADAVVAFCAPNNQNVDGVARIVSSFQTRAARNARYNRELQVLVIPTRIDDSESGLLGEFSARFADRFERDGLVPAPLQQQDRPLWNLQIPYIPKYNYREQLVIKPSPPFAKTLGLVDPPTEKLVKAYENIALHLAVLAPENSPLRRAMQAEIAGTLPYLLPRKAPHLTAPVPVNWVNRPALGQALKETLLVCARAPQGGRMAVWGLAGAGKSTLLAQVCEDPEIKAAFPDGIIWLTLEGAWGKERVQDFLRAQFAIPSSGGQSALTRALEDKRFLFVVDDVWTANQLDAVFAFGNRDSRVIVTRDHAMALKFANTVFTVGMLTENESRDLLKIPPEMLGEIRADAVLSGLLEWPLGAALLRAAVERQSSQGSTAETSWSGLRTNLKSSGFRFLDQPGATGRNGSIELSLRESLSRLTPEARRLLTNIIAVGKMGMPGRWEDPYGGGDRSPSRLLVDLGLAVIEGDRLRAEQVIFRWVVAQSGSAGDIDGARRREREATLKAGNEIVRGRAASLSEMEKTAYSAKDQRAFSLARKLLSLARQHPDAAGLTRMHRLRLLQQHALCTYKDDDTVLDDRLSEALQILNGGDLKDTNPSQETLGLAGSIHKQWWRYSGRRRDLEQSLSFYQRGAAIDLAGDFGYTRINAAFVLDLIAQQELEDSPDSAQSRRQKAASLRAEIVARLPDLASQPANAWLKGEWWYGATMAECLFGLARYSEARYWLREALALNPPAWQLEATTRQLSALARAQGVDAGEESEPWRTMAMLVGDRVEALRALAAGKIGLALSGGGFRASLFHIGVLARLAELDVLRHVEVLSCVSGGSIIGAHYYLEVRRLLQQKRDSEISCADYIEIVKRIERDFLAGVQMNLRSRLFAGWIANVRSILIPGYTRTKYLGELMEKYIYSRVKDGGGSERFLNELSIVPKDGGEEFRPKLDNWRRGAKAPILLLNATTLNTGHVWQFAVTWMGEPPISANSSIDGNDILRRMYYGDAPKGYRSIRLGQAVAASACVPGLFDPVEMEKLFPRRVVRLVDGGVHDNQGIAGLLEQECSVLLVSDASGQMTSKRSPGAGPFNVFMRTQDISMARIREAEYQHLGALRRSSALNGLMFLHLKKDLDIKHVDWIDAQDPWDSSANPGTNWRGTTVTTYGMPKNLQEKIAGLRTDLDAFSDAEAYALMLSGYRMASQDALSLPDFLVDEASREQWDFLAIVPTVDRATDFEPEYERLRTILETGARLPLKVWSLRPLASTAALAGAVALVLLAGLALTWLARNVKVKIPALPPHSGTVAWVTAGCLILYLLIQWWRGRKSLSVIATGLAMVTVGWLVARFQLWFFDPLYRRAGAVRGRKYGREPAPATLPKTG